MVKADTSYDKRVFVIIGGGEFLILFVKIWHLPGGKPLKGGGSACFTLWGKICGMISPGVLYNDFCYGAVIMMVAKGYGTLK